VWFVMFRFVKFVGPLPLPSTYTLIFTSTRAFPKPSRSLQ
jgi:hypothetical protein